MQKRKFNYFNTAQHQVVKEMKATKKPVTNGDTGRIENPLILNISKTTLTGLRASKMANIPKAAKIIIEQQRKVKKDTYNILKGVAANVQPPENVAISTINNKHHIIHFAYDLNPNHFGSYEFSISFSIAVDYDIKDLEKIVLGEVKKCKLKQ